jgi:hypothetical protein
MGQRYNEIVLALELLFENGADRSIPTLELGFDTKIDT